MIRRDSSGSSMLTSLGAIRTIGPSLSRQLVLQQNADISFPIAYHISDVV
jgi:hypothetical protein